MMIRRVKRASAGLAVTSAVAFGSAALTQAPSLSPGTYKGTVQMTLGDEASPAEQVGECFSRADLDRLDVWLARFSGENCAIHNRAASAGRVTFDVVCPDQPGGVRTRGELTLGDNRFEALLRTTSDSLDEADFTVVAAVSRAGDCTK